MRARDIMTKAVRTVTADTPVRAIAELMLTKRISGIPVVDKRRRVIGVVSEADLMRRAESGTVRRRSWWLDLLVDPRSRAREYAKTRGLYARDVMARTVISVTPDTEVDVIADIMERSEIKRVPVIDRQKLVGIVSRRDLLPALARPPRKAGRPSDAAIGAALRKEIRSKGLARDILVNFSVHKGVIDLYGLVPSSEERDAIRVMAETVAGARLVKDNLVVRPMLLMAS